MNPTPAELAKMSDIRLGQCRDDLDVSVAGYWAATGVSRQIYRGYVQKDIRACRLAEARRMQAYAAMRRVVRC
jgi:hypothetical protein